MEENRESEAVDDQIREALSSMSTAEPIIFEEALPRDVIIKFFYWNSSINGRIGDIISSFDKHKTNSYATEDLQECAGLSWKKIRSDKIYELKKCDVADQIGQEIRAEEDPLEDFITAASAATRSDSPQAARSPSHLCTLASKLLVARYLPMTRVVDLIIHLSFRPVHQLTLDTEPACTPAVTKCANYRLALLCVVHISVLHSALAHTLSTFENFELCVLIRQISLFSSILRLHKLIYLIWRKASDLVYQLVSFNGSALELLLS
ncbi:hypothetical protein F511_39577 [Dorcoceras hygrometricum]|uniref:Uncharacterized protein n=1 Tax=Dorcoceras hygrometricum TaxID=472368 RepID=A0A2Z6ZZT7_9LAMI|nr:hypothetical protein F511_39577 [Dorcoceras hygrometricum]